MHPPFDLLCDIASSIVAVENGWMVDLESLRRDITDTSGFASRVAGCEPRSGAEWTGLAGACERLENVLDDLEHGDVSVDVDQHSRTEVPLGVDRAEPGRRRR